MFNLLALLDDIAATMDDVAVMTKVAIKKTSALMSDDLAVNAGVVTGVKANREIPIVKAIFLGSLLNKVYCIVGVLLILAIYPPILNIVLFIGGVYLSYEGAHKVQEKIQGWINKDKGEEKKVARKSVAEKDKIAGAIRTDLILSIEIIVIAYNSIESGGTLEKVLTLIAVGLLASILIYGLVAILVKIDDLGVLLIEKGQKSLGTLLVQSMPYTMKGLGILGTTAMFLVGGGIIMHTFHLPLWAPEILQNLLLGIITGFISLLPVQLKLAYFNGDKDSKSP